MNFKEGLDVADEAVFVKVGRRLSDVEIAILKGSWQRQTYEEIAEATNYSVGYLKRHVGPELWKLLTKALGEEVSKTNFRLSLERKWRSSYGAATLTQRIRGGSGSPLRIRGRGGREELWSSVAGSQLESGGRRVNTSPTSDQDSTTRPVCEECMHVASPIFLDKTSGEQGRVLTSGSSLFNASTDASFRSEPISTGVWEKNLAGASGGNHLSDFALRSLAPSHTDWGEAVDVSVFYGRTAELATLAQWIVADRCRLVALLGIGGIGKTALSVKLAQQVQNDFEYVIWRSLRNASPFETFLAELVFFLSDQQETLGEVSRLLHYLRASRCLLIFDNLETILDVGDGGPYRPGYEKYGELLRMIGETAHQSCLILTSREKPVEIATFEGVELAVRSLRLGGSPEAAYALVEAKGLVGKQAQKQELCDRYGNSPLALKIVATSIKDLFDGEIAEFLQQDTVVFNGHSPTAGAAVQSPLPFGADHHVLVGD